MFQGARNTPKWKGVFTMLISYKEDKQDGHKKDSMYLMRLQSFFNCPKQKNGLNELKTIVGEDVGVQKNGDCSTLYPFKEYSCQEM